MPCPECGQPARTGEVNGSVVRRRQLIRSAEAELQTLQPGSSQVLEGDAHDELINYPQRFFVSLVRAVLRPAPLDGACRELALTIHRLTDLIDVLRAESRLRPAAEARAYLGVAEELARLWPIYRDAATTSDMARAEVLAAEGQKILDDAPASMTTMRTVAEAVEVLSDQGAKSSLVRRVTRALSIRHPGMDFAALCDMGARRARDISGVNVGVGPGLDYLTLELVADAFLDTEAIRLKIQEAVTYCANDQRLHEIAAMEGAVEDLAILRRDVFETLNQFTYVANQEAREAATIRRLAKSVGELYEAALPILVWYRLMTDAPTGPDHYHRLVKENSTGLATDLRKQMPRSFGDMPTYLRNSAHHGRALEFDEAAGTIAIRLRNYEEVMPVEEYVDRSFAFFESLLVINWALSNALDRADVEVPLPPEDAQYMGLSQLDLAAFWLEAAKGVTVSKSAVHEGSWLVEANLEGDDVLFAALTLAATADSRLTSVTVANPGASDDPLVLEYSAYQRYAEHVAAASAEEHLLGMLELLHQTTRGEKCVLTEPDVAFGVMTLAASLLEGRAELVGPLRRVRALANDHGFHSLAQTASSAIASLRHADASRLRAEIARRIGELRVPSLPTAARVTVRLGGTR